MQASLFVDVSVQNVHTDHAGVHGVGILLHSSLGHRFPRMAVDATQKVLQMTFKAGREDSSTYSVRTLGNLLTTTIR